MTEPAIRPATVDDVRTIKSLLARYTLPRADLGRYVDHFLIAEAHGRIAGSAGLEVYGRAAVLRGRAPAPNQVQRRKRSDRSATVPISTTTIVISRMS